MIEFELVPGRKGPLDSMVLVYADGEPLNFSQLLYILAMYFRAEDSYYPKSMGFMGGDMLLQAIGEIRKGAYLPDVCRRYDLEYKVSVR